MSHIQFEYKYQDIISVENLLEAWKEFLNGKRARRDVQEFERNLMHNIILLNRELVAKTYHHSAYQAFNISDPKPRNIHKASVRDRLLHHSIYRVLYPYFDKRFIADSYSCRLNKGTHKAMDRFRGFGYKVSRNHTRTCWVLKCDIKKFFASIDHNLLQYIVAKYIDDEDTLWLLGQITNSFNSGIEGKGLPLGNLTSQLLVNIYMNEFDQYVKHKLKIKHYIRYADDFVILSEDKARLEILIPQIRTWLKDELELDLHPHKVSIKTIASGVDFLGWVHFPSYRVIRATTKRRMFRSMSASGWKTESVQSCLGLLGHGNTDKLINEILAIPMIKL